MNTTLKAALLLSSAMIATPVLAQQQPTPPEHYTLNAQGVDLVTGSFTYAATDVVIGTPGEGGISHGRVFVNGGWRDTLGGTIAVSGSTYTVSLGAQSEVFTKSGTSFIPRSNNGSTLTQNGSAITFTTSGGVVATYSTTYSGSTTPYQANNAALTSVVHPNGERLDYQWNGATYCMGYSELGENGEPTGSCLQYRNAVRLEGVLNNRGYAIDFIYASDTPPADAFEAQSQWLRRTGARGVNRKVDPCSTYPEQCSALTQNWPSVQYNSGDFGGTIESVTDQSGRTTGYTYDGYGLASVAGPGLPAVSVSRANGKVSSVTDASGTWNYTYSDSGTLRTTTANGPLGQQVVTVADLTIGRATSVRNALNQTTAYEYDGQRRLQKITNPEGDTTTYGYDARGNITSVISSPKQGSGQSNIVSYASYPSSCTNVRTCNQPTSTTDARGGVTEYTYDPNHGGVLSVTSPAPTAGAARPQARISYAAHTAQFKNTQGVTVAASSSVTLPISISSCASGSAPSCVGTNDEVRQTIAYATGSNLSPGTVTQSNGTGTLSASTSLTYTANGDVASVDGPLPGADDTTHFRYNAARQKTGTIAPDADAGGPLQRRAERIGYDHRSLPTQVDRGVVNGTSDGDWNGFNTLQSVRTDYDVYGRMTFQEIPTSGTAPMTQFQISYDAAGRVDCTNTRMRMSAIVSTDACAPGAAGAFGPDRITKHGYDAAGRLTSTTSGFNSGTPITEQATYTSNGLPQTLTDGNGNVSTLVYDGFDRLKQTRFPNASGGGSSTSDYEEYGYDAGGNVTSFRNRAGEVIGATYDALGRQTAVNGASNFIGGVYAYDNLGRMTSASAHGGGGTWSATYDALSRVTSQSSVLGTMTSGYDLAGRRTSLQWPDGFWVAYDYNAAGDLTAIRENGATNWQLATWAYDNLGRRIFQGNANGSTTSWGYDGASRLTSLTHDLAGTDRDLQLGFTYNPAGQIVTRTMSNSAYAYSPGAGVTSYANNGRNQVTSVSGQAVGYDGRGNITSAPGVGSFSYNQSNQLTSANGASLFYDPMGRMSRSIGSSEDVMFFYDGQQAVAEYNGSGSLIRRYIPGLGSNEVITAYEGAGYDRRWPMADERGSVTSITNGSAQAITTNTYDEYGQPGPYNSGRFQYTGQMWMPQANLYHYRARAYAPQLGRFMQPDPIGYGDGANLYAYVRADPVNKLDPSGLAWVNRTCSQSFSIGVDGIAGGGSESFTKSWDCSFYMPDGPTQYYDPNTGLGGGGSGGGAGSEQERACSAAAFSGYIGNPTFERQAREAMKRATSTPNRGLAGETPRNGTEHGFFAGYYPWGLAVGPIFTSHRELRLTPERILQPPFAGRLILYHTHQSPSPVATGVLSIPDLRWSNANRIPIIADNEDGKRYCHVPQ